MKILHLIDSGGLYGAEIMLLTLMAEQVNSGDDVYLLSCGLPQEQEKPIEREASKLSVKLITWRIPAGLNIKKMKDLSNWLHEESFDIAHSHGYKFNIMCALGLKKKSPKLKTISTVHGYVVASVFSKMAVYQFLDRLALCKFDHIALVNNGLMAFWPFKWFGQKSVFIPNGLKDIDVSLAAPTSGKRFLAIGRLSVEKQFATLVQCIAKLEGASLTMMGEGPLRANLEWLITDLHLQNRVFLKGFVDKPSQYLNEFDCLVISSSTEGLPMVLLEAMRVGMPVVTTPVGAIAKVVGSKYPLLCDGSTENDILQKMTIFTTMPVEVRLELSIQLRHRFGVSYTSTIMHQKYTTLYKGEWFDR